MGATACASEAAGLPAAEKSGIFWPRATEFIVSIAEMPVWIISSGYVREYGLIGIPRHNNQTVMGRVRGFAYVRVIVSVLARGASHVSVSVMSDEGPMTSDTISTLGSLPGAYLEC